MVSESDRNLRNAAEFFYDINYTDPMNVRMYILKEREGKREIQRVCEEKDLFVKE
jgi:hypothetical protein